MNTTSIHTGAFKAVPLLYCHPVDNSPILGLNVSEALYVKCYDILEDFM